MYFFDSYAIIELLRGNAAYARFAEEPISTSLLNLGEVYYSYLKLGEGQRLLEMLSRLPVDVVFFSKETVFEAMRFRFAHRKQRFSYIDSIGYALARSNGLLFLTGDAQFKGFPGVEFVK